MTKLKYTFTTDTLFKMLFVKHPELLKILTSTLLKISVNCIEKFDITNPEMPPESLGDKFCRLDINMSVNGHRVNLEIQVQNEGDFPERALFHWAREYSTALAEGQNYSLLPRVIIISILNFKQFECSEFHSKYQVLEVSRKTQLNDKLELYFFELPKVPLRTDQSEYSEDNSLLLWLSLFKAETEEDLEKLEALEVPEMKEAIEAYRSITVTPEFQEMERLRSKARHDEAQALYHARNEGKVEGKIEGKVEEKFEVARRMLREGDSLEKIARVTELPLEALKRELEQ